MGAELWMFDDAPQSDPLLEAFDAYNQLAREIGLPVARALTADRRKALKARIKEWGITGWHEAMSRARVSRFLQGNNDRNWKADFDFFLQSKSLRRTLEGGYEGLGHGKSGSSASWRDPATGATAMQLGAADALMRYREQQRGG